MDAVERFAALAEDCAWWDGFDDSEERDETHGSYGSYGSYSGMR